MLAQSKGTFKVVTHHLKCIHLMHCKHLNIGMMLLFASLLYKIELQFDKNTKVEEVLIDQIEDIIGKIEYDSKHLLL